MVLEDKGVLEPRYLIVVEPTQLALKMKVPLFGWQKEQTSEMLLKAGIHPNEVAIISGFRSDSDALIAKINSYTKLNCIFPFGNFPIELTTGKVGQDKWNLSPLDTLPMFQCRKAVPSYAPARLQIDPALFVYWVKSFKKGRECSSTEWQRKIKFFDMNPDIERTIAVLEGLKKKSPIAVDIETGRGQINTVGFAWSSENAIAINVLPDNYGPNSHYRIWELIRDLLVGENEKIYQNFIYEAQYFSKYGITIRNTKHDTMWAQRVLWPEFKVGLDQVGRFYTNEIYWKDDGKNVEAEGGKKDWGNIRDWGRHYMYNCKDTTGTYEGYLGQRKDLTDRGLAPFFYDYLMKLAPQIQEMSLRGLFVNKSVRAMLRSELSDELATCLSNLPPGFNPSSPKQKLEFLRGKGYKIPKQRAAKGEFKESTSELSLKKLRLKHPNDQDLNLLLRYSKAKKALSSYIDTKLDHRERLTYSLDGAGTETLRFSSRKDAFDQGLNAQTLPKKFRKMFVAPEGKQWMQIDLKQAESRYVAYDSCDPTLIEMLETGQDIHRYVGAEIFGKPEQEITHNERQLGKKSGHSANYCVGVNSFLEACLKEMDLVLTKKEAENALEAYHRRFPEIRAWHRRIRHELWQKRKLTNPFGFARHFYGRLNDNTYREAYAWKPQSTIPAITNHLMLNLDSRRKEGQFSYDLHLQVHDSLIILIEPNERDKIASYCKDLNNWHPEIILPGGQLRIPVDVEYGESLGELQAWEG